MKNRKEIGYSILAIALLALFFISPQLFQRSLIVANDWIFHMNRYYETAMQIQTGHFNYFQSLFGFNQSGRVINAMYGADFAYFAGLILTVVKSWYHFELILNFLCFFIAGSSMYILVRYAKLSNQIALLSALLYMGSPLIVWWTTTQAFSGMGAAFLPLAFIPAIRMIQNPNKPVHPILFGSIIALLLSVHMFTAFLACLAILPFYIIGFLRTNRKKQMVGQTALAVLIAVCLSLNTFAAILDLHTDTLIMPLEASGLYNGGTFLSLGSMNYNNFGLIFSLIFVFQMVLTIFEWKQTPILIKVVNVTGMVFFIISSKYVPWNHLTGLFPSLLSIQFLRRFSGVTCVLLILGFGYSMNHLYQYFDKKEAKKALLVGLAVLGVSSTTSGWQLIDKQAQRWNSDAPLSGDTNAAQPIETDPAKIRAGLTSDDLSKIFMITQKPTSDYLPTKTNLINGYSTYSKEILHNDLPVTKTITNDAELKLTWNGSEIDQDTIQLPVIVYNHSTLELDGKKITAEDYTLSDIGAFIIKNDHKEHTLIVGYQPSILFILSLYIKGISVIALILYGVWSFTKRTTHSRKSKIQTSNFHR
ncbi:hypothetical protein [Enterococcus sp. N249-2]